MNITAEHPGIAACDIDGIFLIGKPPCKMFPSVNILNLIEQKYRFILVHSPVGLQYRIKILICHLQQTLVVKINVHEFLKLMPLSQKLPGPLIEHVGLAGLTDTHKNIPAVVLKLKRPVVELDIPDCFLPFPYQ